MTPEEYAKMHQKSFRIAFDFLNTHFPPGTEPEWWDRAAKELSDASIMGGETKLVIELLVAVYNYLGEEYKKRSENNGCTEN